MIVTEKIEVSDEILASGGFADVRSGKYMGHLVAVKTVRVTAQDDFLKIRKVRTDDIFCHLGRRLSHSALAILQGSRSLEHAIPPERLGACWGSG